LTVLEGVHAPSRYPPLIQSEGLDLLEHEAQPLDALADVPVAAVPLAVVEPALDLAEPELGA
jgi:hypothetical protein